MAETVDELATAYKRVFSGEDGAIVLRDLMGATYAVSSEWDADPRKHALNSGRRQIWLHMSTFLALTSEEIADLLRGRSIQKQTMRERYGVD